MLEGQLTGDAGGGVQSMTSLWRTLRPQGMSKWTHTGGSWESFFFFKIMHCFDRASQVVQ